MYKRKVVFFAVIVAVAAIVFSVPSDVCAGTTYPIRGKVINDNIPEIKWEDGDAGADPSGKVNFLDYPSDPSLNNIEKISVNKKVSNALNLDEKKTLYKYLWKLLILNLTNRTCR